MPIKFDGPKLLSLENYDIWAVKAQAYLAIIECNGAIFYDYSKPYRPSLQPITTGTPVESSGSGVVTTGESS